MADVTRIGIVGTSWWTEGMYLPALTGLDGVEVVSVVGRNDERRAEVADEWGIPSHHASWEAMLDEASPDGVVVAAPNDLHEPITVEALGRGIAVLCEKPLANDVASARAMADAAARTDAPTMVPFTYGFMPSFLWLERLVRDGRIGEVHAVRADYSAGYGRDPAYSWRMDERYGRGGGLADIGSHVIHLVHRIVGSVGAVTARLEQLGERSAVDPSGEPYPRGCDAGTLITEHENGAHGVVQFSTLNHEGGLFSQRHMLEVNGADGTLRMVIDWDETQDVTLTRVGGGAAEVLPIPDEIWGGVRRDKVVDTYKDVFRTTDAMARRWATSIGERRQVSPDIAEGLAVQRVIEAALLSSETGRRVELAEI